MLMPSIFGENLFDEIGSSQDAAHLAETIEQS